MKHKVIALLLAVGTIGASVAYSQGPPLPASETVEPGDPAFTNGDGVKVTNTGDEDEGDFVVTPKSGNANDSTEVEAKNDAKGSVEDIDGNDTVNCANGSAVTITGTGGTVNASPGSSGTVTNTNPTSPAGLPSITIRIGSGSVQVPPGATVPFTG